MQRAGALHEPCKGQEAAVTASSDVAGVRECQKAAVAASGHSALEAAAAASRSFSGASLARKQQLQRPGALQERHSGQEAAAAAVAASGSLAGACTILSWLPCLILSCVCFLLHPYCNMMQCLLQAALPPPVLVSDKILFTNDAISSPSCLASSSARCLLKSCSYMMHYPLLTALSHPLLYSLLIESLSKYCAISPPSCLGSSCARFLLHPCSNMMR